MSFMRTLRFRRSFSTAFDSSWPGLGSSFPPRQKLIFAGAAGIAIWIARVDGSFAPGGYGQCPR